MAAAAAGGPFLLYSGSSMAAIGVAIDLLRQRAGRVSGPLRLVVLQTPLDTPLPGEVAVLRQQFLDHGVDVEAVDPGLQTRDDAFRPEVIETLERADVILVTGGNPIRMTEVLRDTPALAALHRAGGRGTIIGGGSAGAMVFGAGMLDGPARNPHPEPVPLLSLLPNLVVAPHFGNYPIAPWQAAFPDRTVLGLPDGAAALVTGGTHVASAGERSLTILPPEEPATDVAPGDTWTLGERI